MQATRNNWLGFLRIGIFIIPLLVSSLWTVKPQAEERVPLVCSVHQQPLKHDLVQILYGLRGPADKGYIEAARKLFPHSNKESGGGCVISWDSPKFQQVDYCPKCRKAETEWRRARADSQK